MNYKNIRLENNYKSFFLNTADKLADVSKDFYSNDDLKTYRNFMSRISLQKPILDIRIAIIFFSYLKFKNVDIDNLEELYNFKNDDFSIVIFNCHRRKPCNKKLVKDKSDLIVRLNHKLIESVDAVELASFIGVKPIRIYRYKQGSFTDIRIALSILKFFQIKGYSINLFDLITYEYH